MRLAALAAMLRRLAKSSRPSTVAADKGYHDRISLRRCNRWEPKRMCSALLRTTRHKGHQKLDWNFTLAAAAYNLVRIAKVTVAN